MEVRVVVPAIKGMDGLRCCILYRNYAAECISNLLATLMSIVVTAVVHGVSFRQLSCAKGLLEQ